MKIALAQINSVIGDIQKNIDRHVRFVEEAINHNADLVIFPELSLSGYAPELVNDLATTHEDSRLSVFQELSDNHKISVGLGLPFKSIHGVSIALLIFQPGLAVRVYHKFHLHEDELPFFVSGPNYDGALEGQDDVAFAVCYEINIPEHSEAASERGAGIYIASVAKTVNGVANAWTTLSETADKRNMVVLLSNCTGICEGQTAGGKSAAWNTAGDLVGSLNDTQEGLLIYDRKSSLTEAIYFEQDIDKASA